MHAIRRVGLTGVELAYLEQGSGPLLLCVHGFPDTACGFAPVMERLARAGYRVVAPFLRGYHPSGLARDGDYRITTVARDLIELIDALGERRACLVGHDWGAVATYIASTAAPDRIVAAVTAAVPHLRRFLLHPTWAQLVRSRYMGYFQLPRIPERRIARDDFAWLRQLIRRWSPGWNFTDADLAPVIATLSRPEHCSAALAYYRTLPRILARRGNWSSLLAPMPVPAKVIYGSVDGCIGAEMFVGQEACFAAAYERVCIDGAGHFMQCEQPERFADEVLAFFAKHAIR